MLVRLTQTQQLDQPLRRSYLKLRLCLCWRYMCHRSAGLLAPQTHCSVVGSNLPVERLGRPRHRLCGLLGLPKAGPQILVLVE